MLSRIAYAFRETGSNLRRNFTLTAASLITVVVSLTLVGVSLLIRQAVDNALVRWKGGVEFIVFMKPDATADQLAAVNRDLEENPQVRSVRFVDKPEAYEEFKTLFPDSPELTESLQIEQMPPSYRVVPLTDDSAIVGALGTQFEGKPGVFAVEYSKEALDWLRSISRFLGVGLIIAAGVLLVAAVLLIWNTIRTAIFARRREVEVMKLVGATNWFIRVPFMLEGLVQGIVGRGGGLCRRVVAQRLLEEPRHRRDRAGAAEGTGGVGRRAAVRLHRGARRRCPRRRHRVGGRRHPLPAGLSPTSSVESGPCRGSTIFGATIGNVALWTA